MKIAIVYATTEGQTRKIARFAADHLTERGATVELLPAAEAGDLDLSRFGAAILAASVHLGAYQPGLRDFARGHAADLAALPTLFLSVSLAAAGDDPDDWVGLAKVIGEFEDETGWTPARLEHVAGAFRFTEYDFFRSWAMRWIASQKGQRVDPHADTEYTDWAALARLLDEWLDGLS